MAFVELSNALSVDSSTSVPSWKHRCRSFSTLLPSEHSSTMQPVDCLVDKFSYNVAIGALSGLVVVVLPFAWHLLAVDTKAQLGTRNVVRPKTTKPLIGNTLDVIGNMSVRHDWFASLCADAEGDPVLIQSVGTLNMTLLSTPEAFEDVLKTQFDNFPKGPTKAELLREINGEGIFAVDHAKWYRQRKVASTLFTMRALRETMTSTIM